MRSDGASILAAARVLEGEFSRTPSARFRIRTPSCGEGEGIA